MTLIHLTTFIEAPAQRVFDLSRSINLHMASMQHTGETAVAGKTSGLITLGETVIWQARHLFKNRQLKVKITAMEPPAFFKDEMVQGDFAAMEHEHHFKPVANGTIMIDLFAYRLPWGKLGQMADRLYLKNYLHTLLLRRNATIQQYAVSNRWREVLPQENHPKSKVL